MAKKSNQIDDSLPTEVTRLIQLLVKSWQVWKWVFGVLAAIAVLVLGWLANETYNARVSLAKVEAMPNQVERIDSRLQAVERLLVKLDDLPAKVEKLGEASRALQAEFATISKGVERVSHVEKSLGGLASKVTDLQATVSTQGISIDRAAERVRDVGVAVNAQVREFEVLRTQSQSLARALRTLETARKRYSLFFPLPVKPDAARQVGKSTIFEFRLRTSFLEDSDFSALRVERVELRSSEQKSDGKLPVVLAEVTLVPEAKVLLLSLQTDMSEAFLAAQSRGALVVIVTLED